jgi:hypothetical protein
VLIGIDTDKVVSGILANLLIQLGKDAIPVIKRTVIEFGRASLQVFSRSLSWFKERSVLTVLSLPGPFRCPIEVAFQPALFKKTC